MFRLMLLIVVLATASCQNLEMKNQEAKVGSIPEAQKAAYDEYEEDALFESNENSSSTLTMEKGSKVIKNGNLRMEVNALQNAKTRIDEIVSKYEGHYENEHYNSYGNRIEYALLIRIPAESFDEVITDIESGNGKLISKNVNASDVTEEYVDLTIRLENNLAYLEQYKSILKKANSIKDILEVQEKIRRLEEEIESKKGRIKFLDDQVSYSTISLELTELVSVNYSNQPRFITRIGNAFQNGFKGFLGFVVGLVGLWPFILIVVLILVFRKRITRLFRPKRK